MNFKLKTKLVVAGTGFPDVIPMIESINAANVSALDFLGFLDDNENNKSRDLLGHSIIGGFEWLKSNEDVLVFNSIARDLAIRDNVNKKLIGLGAKFISLLSPEVNLSYSEIGEGCFIGRGVYLGPKTQLDDYSLVLANTAINHDTVIGKNCFVGTGVNIQGHVKVGDNSFIASGAVLAPGIQIGVNCKIGLNALITHDLPDNQTYFSRPAKKLIGMLE